MGGLGFGASGVVIGLLGLGEITLLAATQLIILGSSAVGVALVAGGLLAAYQFYQEYKKIKELENDLEAKLKTLKDTLIELIKNHQLLENERAGLAQDKIPLINTAQAEIENKIKTILSKVSVPNTTDPSLERLTQLTHLFVPDSLPDKSTIIDYAFPNQNQIDPILTAGLDVIWEKLQPRITQAEKDAEKLKLDEEKLKLDNNIENIKKSEPKMNRFEKFGRFVRSYVLPAFVGFGAVAGSAMTLVPLIAGVASLAAVGWPVLVPVLVSALVVGVVGAVVYNRLKSRQEKIQEKIELATAQVSGMSGYLKENLTAQTFKEIEDHKLHQKEIEDYKLRQVEEPLKRYENAFNGLQKRNDLNFKNIKSAENDLNNNFKFPKLIKQVRGQKKEKEVIIELLLHLRGDVNGLVISLDLKDQSDRKEKLIIEINKAIKKARVGGVLVKENIKIIEEGLVPKKNEAKKENKEAIKNLDHPEVKGKLSEEDKHEKTRHLGYLDIFKISYQPDEQTRHMNSLDLDNYGSSKRRRPLPLTLKV